MDYPPRASSNKQVTLRRPNFALNCDKHDTKALDNNENLNPFTNDQQCTYAMDIKNPWDYYNYNRKYEDHQRKQGISTYKRSAPENNPNLEREYTSMSKDGHHYYNNNPILQQDSDSYLAPKASSIYSGSEPSCDEYMELGIPAETIAANEPHGGISTNEQFNVAIPPIDLSRLGPPGKKLRFGPFYEDCSSGKDNRSDMIMTPPDILEFEYELLDNNDLQSQSAGSLESNNEQKTNKGSGVLKKLKSRSKPSDSSSPWKRKSHHRLFSKRGVQQ